MSARKLVDTDATYTVPQAHDPGASKLPSKVAENIEQPDQGLPYLSGGCLDLLGLSGCQLLDDDDNGVQHKLESVMVTVSSPRVEYSLWAAES